MPFDLPPLRPETPQERWARLYSLAGDYKADMKKVSRTSFVVGFWAGFVLGILGLGAAWILIECAS